MASKVCLSRRDERVRESERRTAHSGAHSLSISLKSHGFFTCVVQIKYLELPHFGNSAHTCLQFTAGGKGESIAHLQQCCKVGPLSGSLNPRPAHGSALASTLHRERSQGLPRRQEAAECVGPAECDARGARVASLLGALLSS